MTGEERPPIKLDRLGLGYAGVVIAKGIEMRVDRITESRGEMHGEMLVTRTGEGNLMRQRVNLTSSVSRSSVAKLLAAKSNHVDWSDLLERFCMRVVDEERAPEPLSTLGHSARRPRPPMALYPMLPAGKPTILYGAEGSFKSTIAAALAFARATGVSPFEGWEVQQVKGPVLVLDWEADNEDWNDRIAGIAAGADYSGPLPVLYRRCHRPITDLLHEVGEHISRERVSTVVVDSIGMASPQRHDGGDANESAIRIFSVLRSWGVTSLLIDHISKDSDGKRPYGSTYKPALARMTWQVVADEDERGLVTLTNRKVNDMANRGSFAMRVSMDEMGGPITLRPAAVPVTPEARELSGQVAAIVEALEEAGHALDEKELEDASGVMGPRRVIAKPNNRDLFLRVPGGWALKEWGAGMRQQ